MLNSQGRNLPNSGKKIVKRPTGFEMSKFNRGGGLPKPVPKGGAATL